jgi:hypothetical protein
MTDERRQLKELEFNEPRRALKMSTSQTKLRIWIGFFAMIMGVGVVVFYSYCFGLWGRQIPLFQYLFQCNCPGFSEEWRYPKQVDIIVSACRNTGMRISPSGRLALVYVGQEIDGKLSTFLLDLATREEIPLTLPEGSIYFLNDELIYIFVHYDHSHEGGEHILDLRTNTMYPIQKFVYWRPGSFIDGNADLNKLAESLQDAENVYYIRDGRLLVALPKDFAANPNQAFLSGASDIPYNGDVNRVEPFLYEYNISYKYIPPIFPGEAISPNGKFIARHDGIYSAATNQKIVDGYKFSWYYRSYSGQYLSLRGWKYDSSGAIYSQFIGPCLLEPWGLDGPGCIWEVPQPLLLLKVPEEYLSSTRTP